MGAIYNSAYDLLMQESEASEAYKKRKAKEAHRAEAKSDRRMSAYANSRIDSASEEDNDRRIANVARKNPGLKKDYDKMHKEYENELAGKPISSEKELKKRAGRLIGAMDAKDRHDRRHPKKESAGYGIFSSIIAEEQIDDPDLGDGVDELGMGDRDFGDNMEADTMMGESSIQFY